MGTAGAKAVGGAAVDHVKDAYKGDEGKPAPTKDEDED